MRILGISRAWCFSPNSSHRDAAIFNAVADRLRDRGHHVSLVSEEDTFEPTGYDVVFSMGRDRTFLEHLSEVESSGLVVVNSAKALLNGTRVALAVLFENAGLPVAPSVLLDKQHLPLLKEGERYWLKRGDACAQSAADVCLIHSEEELRAALDDFLSRGVTQPLLSPHIEGDLVKFYGVEGTDFFHYYYPTAEGAFSKFGLERHNGVPAGYAFSPRGLKETADRAARLSGFVVYGGDCVVKADGTWQIIDFNDWPSFSRCCDEAAAAIASRIVGSI